MNGLVLLSASSFIYFTYRLLDDAFWEASSLAGLQRDPNKQLRYAKFIEHFYHHVLDVAKIEGVAVQTGRQCLLRRVTNDRCFSANTGAFHLPNGNISCDLLPTDKYNASEKFKTNHTFHHYGIMSPCESFPCQNGGTCQALYEIDDYRYTCRRNFTGKNCENETPTTMTPTTAECLLKTTSGKCCSIPFSYKGVTYHSCTTVDYDRLCCSLDAIYTPGNWEDCA